MAKRILYIKPGAVPGVGEHIRNYLQQYAAADTVLDVYTSPYGPKHVEYEYYQALSNLDILKAVRRAEIEGYDGAIIGCFADPVLDAAREICDRMVVVAPSEAAMSLAATLADRFSLILIREKIVPMMMRNVIKYGHMDHLASVRLLGMGVLDLQKDPDYTARRMREEIGRAVREDRAEAVILGCTQDYGFYAELQKEFRIPVLDVILCALKQCEYLIGLKQKANWYFSKKCRYSGPDPEEIRKWRIPEDYGLGDLWK